MWTRRHYPHEIEPIVNNKAPQAGNSLASLDHVLDAKGQPYFSAKYGAESPNGFLIFSATHVGHYQGQPQVPSRRQAVHPYDGGRRQDF